MKKTSLSKKLYELAKKNVFYAKHLALTEHPNFLNELLSEYKKETFSESLFVHINGTESCLCKKCSSPLTFLNINDGYMMCQNCIEESIKKSNERGICKAPGCSKPVEKGRAGWLQYCSKSCRNTHNSLISREKAKETYRTKTGYDHPLQNPDVLSKMYEKNLKKFGYRNTASVPEFRQKGIETCIRRYGVKSSFSDHESRQRVVDLAASKYGYAPGTFTNVSQISEVHAKKLESGYNVFEYKLPSGKVVKLQGYENRFYDIVLKKYEEELFSFDPDYIPYVLGSDSRIYFPDGYFTIADTVIEVKSDYTLSKDLEKNIEKARAASTGEGRITFYIPSEVGDRYNFNSFNARFFEIYDRLEEKTEVNIFHELNGYILSLYFPKSKVGVYVYDPSFNIEGIVPKDYLYGMKQYFLNHGIDLLIVSVDELHRPAWITTVKHKVGILSERIYARKCEVREVTKGSDNFLVENHIQGKSSTGIKYGLFYEEELVALMSFSESKNRKGVGKNRGEGAFELVRYATSKHIVGGASKLLKHFERTHNPQIVYSYSDNDVSNGDMYKRLGFELENEYYNDYFFYSSLTNESKHRFSLSKKKLKEKYSHYDEKLSGDQIAELNGFVKVRKTGKKTWVKKYGK